MHTAHKICNAGQWTEAAGDAYTDTKCTACSTGRFRAKAPSDGKAEHEFAVCIVHSICKAGEWTKATGTAVTDTTCVPCKAGSFREKAPTISTFAEQEAHVCRPHKVCSAGQWTKAVGTRTMDTMCVDCDHGTWRKVAPQASHPAEVKHYVCRPHKLCTAGQWTRTAGSLTHDTECVFCSSGRFRKVGPTVKTPEVEAHVCLVHRSCQAGEWTVSAGTVVEDTGCQACAAGTARPSAPRDKTTVETPRSCPACTGASEYSDERGLRACKACSAGHFGVVMGSQDAKGGHTACDDATCERPTHLPANSIVVAGKCPDHGTHTGSTADTCTLTCLPGFYSSASSRPFTCAPDSKASAAYQGGAITCTGALLDVWEVGRVVSLSVGLFFLSWRY